MASKLVDDPTPTSHLSICFLILLQDELGKGLDRERSWSKLPFQARLMLTPQGALELRNPFRMTLLSIRRLIFTLPDPTVAGVGFPGRRSDI